MSKPNTSKKNPAGPTENNQAETAPTATVADANDVVKSADEVKESNKIWKYIGVPCKTGVQVGKVFVRAPHKMSDEEINNLIKRRPEIAEKLFAKVVTAEA